jgi:hypothetical protein
MFRKNIPRDGKAVREGSMTTAADVIETAREFIETAGEGETVKARLRSAARDLGIPFGVAKRIRYGEVKSVPTHIFLTILERYDAVLTAAEQRQARRHARHRAILEQWRGLREGTGA